MGLSALLARTRPHALTVALPGHGQVRMTVEAAACAAGGVLAGGAADADVLLVAGNPWPQLRHVIDVTWAQLPGPRAQVQATATGEVADALAVAIATTESPHAAACFTGCGGAGRAVALATGGGLPRCRARRRFCAMSCWPACHLAISPGG